MKMYILPLYPILQLLFNETNALQNVRNIIDTPLLDLKHTKELETTAKRMKERIAIRQTENHLQSISSFV